MSDVTLNDTSDNDAGELVEVPDEVKAKAKAEHPAALLRILVVKRPHTEILIKIPEGGALDIYRKDSVAIGDTEKMSGAAAMLFWGCVLWPSVKELRRVFREEGTHLTPDVLGREIVKLAGENQAVRVKKL